ncbi:stage II sporulation protein M [Paenibacillus sp. Marseille-Q4541]|uniref:stage II sporulation protein M n=1 Tax=Paenibacillus sp. Marseille-Q4541 TaxID=2831522 RepID=UPI001BA79B44|nr:stage II sporulation protein M [Paenibacillus sp. Marseille-Q4541]
MFRFQTFLKDLKSTSRYILAATIIFLIGGVLGWVSTGALQDIMIQQISGLKEISEQLQQGDHIQWNFFTFIFWNNAVKAVLVIFAGVLAGIIPIFFLVINGGVLGFLLHLSWQQDVSMYDVVVKGLLPHGIIEIPAIIIACAFGLKFGVLIIKYLGELNKDSRARTTNLRAFMKQTVTASIWIVILLFVAAIIESTITFALVQ